jgi:hypothetical protein
MLTATPVACPTVYHRRQPQLGELGIDLPSVDSMLNAGRAVYYVGIGSVLIVGALFAWRLVDLVFGD